MGQRNETQSRTRTGNGSIGNERVIINITSRGEIFAAARFCRCEYSAKFTVFVRMCGRSRTPAPTGLCHTFRLVVGDGVPDIPMWFYRIKCISHSRRGAPVWAPVRCSINCMFNSALFKIRREYHLLLPKHSCFLSFL